MEKLVLNVDGMSCSHCVKRITDTLMAIDGITSVDVSLENKTVTVEHKDSVSKEVIQSEIEDIGYDVL